MGGSAFSNGDQFQGGKSGRNSSMKTPRSKHQAPDKLQAPSSKVVAPGPTYRPWQNAGRLFGVWTVGAYLVFGVWSFFPLMRHLRAKKV